MINTVNTSLEEQPPKEENPKFEITNLLQWKQIPEGKSQFSGDFIRENKAIKLSTSNDIVIIGQVSSELSIEYWQTFFPNCSVQIYQITESDFLSYFKRKISGNSNIENLNTKVLVSEKVNLESEATASPVVDLVNGWLIEGIRRNASDIHIERKDEVGFVRYRQDGVLISGDRVPSDRIRIVGNRIKILSGMNLMENRLPQEGRFSITLDGHTKDIRVSYIPAIDGYSLVLRILGDASLNESLAHLGFSTEITESLKEVLKTPHGLFLCCGPTGSGKTTTINALVKELPLDQMKVISIEDPVEYIVNGVNQLQVNEEIGLSYSNILKRVLRQDPDCIVVGEIRDEETASLAIRAALTGHLVISSLHTIDSITAIDRLANLKIPRDLISTLTRGIMSQRLARKKCNACQGEGGECCHFTGYSGRIAVTELLTPPNNQKDWMKHPEKYLTQSLSMDAKRLLEAEHTDSKELIRVGVSL
jgi:general secretion pathway protein E